MQRSTQHPRRRAWLRRLIVIAVLAAAVGALLSQTVFAQTSYIITDGDRVTVHRSYSSDPYEVLTEAGIELEEEDTYETGYADGMNQITVRRMQMVTVINRGAQSVIGTYGETPRPCWPAWASRRARATRSRAAARRRPTTA